MTTQESQIQIVGTLELASKYRYGLTSRGVPLYLFHPYDDALPDFIVGSSERDLSQNQLAIVSVNAVTTETSGPEKPRGQLVQLLGPVGDPRAERAALLHQYCAHKQKTKPEIVTLLTANDTEEDVIRQELSAKTGWLTFHVDPPGCRDIDDAIAWNPATGEWAVTIADAAAAVSAGSDIDTTACAIGQTFYALDGRVVRPMLPPAISENTTSLLPDQRRQGVSLFWNPTSAAPAETERFALTWITVDHSFTYDTFSSSDIARRVGIPVDKDPHDWIAEQMIRYNAAAARVLKAASVGILRTQSPADAAAVATWTAIDTALARLAQEAAIYQPATTDNEHQGHASLGLPAYCHASSPLRRYADLFNQRALKALIAAHPQTPDTAITDIIAAHLNERTRAERRWTRDLTFLEHVTPGRVHTIDVLWVSADRVWVPAWGRLLRIRHAVAAESTPTPGSHGQIRIFCDPTKRNWRQRILTAAAVAAVATPPTI
jgi:exoribonuclease R